jgi:hypothetical protein
VESLPTGSGKENPIESKLDPYSTEVFDKHNIADALIGLRKQNPSAIRRDSQSGRSLERVFLCYANLHHPARGKAEKVDRWRERSTRARRNRCLRPEQPNNAGILR